MRDVLLSNVVAAMFMFCITIPQVVVGAVTQPFAVDLRKSISWTGVCSPRVAQGHSSRLCIVGQCRLRTFENERRIIMLLDICCFEVEDLPALPNGDALVLRQTGTSKGVECLESNAGPAAGIASADDIRLWRAIWEYTRAELSHPLDVGHQVWPSANVLCRWMASNAEQFYGKTLLELGSGVGACGLYAAGLGASRVLLTDGSDDLLEVIAVNIAANTEQIASSSSVTESKLLWGSQPPQGPWDWVIASDVTYVDDAETYQQLSWTLSALAASGSRIVLAHEHRSRHISAVLASWDQDDAFLQLFRECAGRLGLQLYHLVGERPRSSVQGIFRLWTPDISLFEVSYSSFSNDVSA